MYDPINELYQTNNDLIYILNAGHKIGWTAIKAQSVNRIVYLSKVLYSFVNGEEPNLLKYYHFTVTASGPTSSIINRSLIDLESREFVKQESIGLKLNIDGSLLLRLLDVSFDENGRQRQEWFRVIILLLGKFGENRIFAFAINDPLYIESVSSNSVREITFEFSENKTLEVLNSFKEAFEASISVDNGISKEDYLELYFDYIFGQIIK